MTDVPNESIVRRIKHIMQRDGELDCPEPGGKVPAASTNALDEKLSQLVGQGLKLANRKPPQVRRDIDGIEQRIRLVSDHQTQSTLRRGQAGNERAGTPSAASITETAKGPRTRSTF